MRIRSNLTDGTIYETVRARRSSSRTGGDRHLGGDSPRSSSRSPGRRLMRLVILLTLVLILMREAANPDVYRNFFGALGAPLVAEPLPLEITQSQLQEILASQIPNIEVSDSEVSDTEVSQPQPEATQTASGSPKDSPKDSPVDSPENLAPNDSGTLQPLPSLDTLVAELGKDGRRGLTNWLAKVRRYERSKFQETATDEETAAEEIEIARNELVPESELLDMVASAAAGSGQLDSQAVVALLGSTQNLLSPAGQRLRAGLQAALDRDYLRRVSDATIWTKSDADAFYRWLEIGSTDELARTEKPVYVGFVSLLDQPAVYRGARVAIRGTAVRAEQLTAAKNPFGIEEYWLIWIRPDDGSDRPIMGYAEQVPSVLQQLTSTGVEEGPAVLLDGVFLRRHLYQSQKGSELAPVIVGKVHSLEQTPNSLIANQLGSNPQASPQNTNTLSSQLTKLIVIAAIFGVGFTLLVARYTAKTGRWRREIRHRGLTTPVDFLQNDSLQAADNLQVAGSLQVGPQQPESSTATRPTRPTSEGNSHD